MVEKTRKPLREIVTLDQWVEVTMQEGITVTELYPSSEELSQKLARLSSPPDLVYRRIHFRGGVPEEYEWVQPTEQQRELGGICVQRLTVGGWQELLSDESTAGGHLKPSDDPRPRPQVRGDCECASCIANRQRLEDLGIDAV